MWLWVEFYGRIGRVELFDAGFFERCIGCVQVEFGAEAAVFVSYWRRGWDEAAELCWEGENVEVFLGFAIAFV